MAGAGDGEAVMAQHCGAEQAGVRAARRHFRPHHVGAIGEIGRQPALPPVRVLMHHNMLCVLWTVSVEKAGRPA